MSAFLLAAIAVALVLLFGAVAELHRQLLQIRKYAGLVDDARPIEFNREVRLSALGLFDNMEVGATTHYAVVVLSDSCATCGDIAQRLLPLLSPQMAVVLSAQRAERAEDWLELYGLSRADVAVDEDRTLSDSLGVHVSPSVVRFQGNVPLSATTLPSPRQLENVVKWLRSGRASDIKIKEGPG